MNKHIKELIILMIGVAILAVIWLPKLKDTKKVVISLEPGKPSIQISEVQPAEHILPTGLTGNIAYTGRENRDPLDNSFVISKKEIMVEEAPKTPLPQLLISAVIWGSSKPQAIINNKIITVGETIEGVKVVNIGKEGIKINFNGEETILPIK
ncbi:MAG: hypothetical protein NTV07_04470 [Candidatus Omnitrophica bacterium]|nr:hypothetical protein [Candidatus Omnitrophota bacterium]